MTRRRKIIGARLTPQIIFAVVAVTRMATMVNASSSSDSNSFLHIIHGTKQSPWFSANFPDSRYASEVEISSPIQTRRQTKEDKGNLFHQHLSICRNIHLSEKTFRAPSLPGPSPYNSIHITETFTLGRIQGGSNSFAGGDDTDVSFFIDPSTSSTNFLAENVQFKIHFSANHDDVKLLRVDYTEGNTDGTTAGIQIGDPTLQRSIDTFYAFNKDENDMELLQHEVTDDKFHSYTLRSIPHSSYMNPESIPWTDMRHVSITYGLEKESTARAEDVEVKVKLLQLCQTLDQPYFCAEKTLDDYQEHCHDCHCDTCHDCGCSEKLPWEHCSAHGKCDHDGCWCHPACVCCSDCAGHSCNCEECCDTSSLSGCSLGSTYEIISTEPVDGMDGTEIDVVIKGKGFYGNADDITCQFGATNTTDKSSVVQVPGYYRSPTELFCTIPPQTLPTGVAKLSVPVSISLDGVQFTPASSDVNFTYYNCPHGCSDSSSSSTSTSTTCLASVCQCPAHFYGPNCTLQCTDCVHGSCLSNSGSCVCDFGYTGERCDVECPGGWENPCFKRGSCFIASDLEKNDDTADTAEAEAVCYCSPGYWGDSCQFQCPLDDKGAVCAGRGTCNANTGECRCDAGYYGVNCASACPGLSDTNSDDEQKSVACGGNGVCCTGTGVSLMYSQCDTRLIGSCACDAGWGGETCEEPSCFDDCYGHGSCTKDGTCICSEGYDGKFCSLQEGQNSSLTYFSFLESSHMVAERVGVVSVNVERFGKLSDEVSVMYETIDLTAEAGEDYVATSGRLHWSSMDGSTRMINVTLIENEWPEGEESFKVILNYPEPINLASLGGTPMTIVRISAKAEIIDGGLDVARITLRILKPWDEVKPGEKGGEELKSLFRDATLSATGILSEQFYLQTIVATDEDRVLLTFDILPLRNDDNAEKHVKKAADDFVSAVANMTSAMYGSFEMTQGCPIDISFKPEIHMVSFDSEGREKSYHGERVSFFLFLSCSIAAAAFAYVNRDALQERLFLCLVVRKFHSLRGSPDHDVVFEGDYGDASCVSRGGGFQEFAIARVSHQDRDDDGGGLLFNGLKKKVLQIEMT